MFIKDGKTEMYATHGIGIVLTVLLIYSMNGTHS